MEAFLAATRSVPVLLAKGKDVGWPTINGIQAMWKADDQKLERRLANARNGVVHEGKEVTRSGIKYVPEAQLPRPYDHLRGRAIRRRLPNTLENRRGVREFAIDIDGIDRPAVECCTKYLELMERMVTAVEGQDQPGVARAPDGKASQPH